MKKIKSLLRLLRVTVLVGGAGALFSVMCVMCSGCASSGYLTDRCRDGADIFTATIGGGLGAKVRAGPLHLGLIAEGEGRGLRGGTFPDVGSFKKTFLVPDSADIQGIFVGMESFESGDSIAARRKKHFQAETFACISAPRKPDSGRPDCPSYYTQLDVVLALGPSVRLGFNPGELLDFVLGWAKVDIYGDDLNAQEDKRDKACVHPGVGRKYGDGYNGEWYCTSCGKTWPASINVGLIGSIICTNGQVQAGDFIYTTSSGALTLVRYTGRGGAVSIPGSINGLPVASIGNGVFSGCKGLTSVTIPDSVTSIGRNAFDSCAGLTNITIPRAVTNLETGAFGHCDNLRGVYFCGDAPGTGGYTISSVGGVDVIPRNAPGTAEAVFEASWNVVVYYLEGTTGWGAKFGRCPTMLWNQQAE